ncbi:L-selectin [Bombina bombina]|uniref:L-selectin n=1 Tax=Bombina bombina TaxID=8345 RepID=UPI00235A8F4A|nr:L-selectin [Bombina bombina]
MQCYKTEGKLQNVIVIWNKFKLFTIIMLYIESLNWTTVSCWTYHYSTGSLNYEQARIFCQTHYTDLVAIQNKREIKHLEETIPYHNTYYWIGIRKINDKWTWVGTNKTLTGEAENWGKGEPNNKGSREDCVEIYIGRKVDAGKWNDDACKKLKRALCYTASCNKTLCGLHGECIETINNYTCNCDEGFYGDHCQYVVQCPRLVASPQGYINCSHPWGNFSFQSSCLFGCSEGFQLSKSVEAECLSSGNWSNTSPSCIVSCNNKLCGQHGECIETMNNYTCNCEEGFYGNHCQYVVQCPRLVASPQSYINCSHPWGNFSFQSSCLFGCAEGFKLSKSVEAECLSSGNWSNTSPSCIVSCNNKLCGQHGECIETMNNYACNCDEGFYGDHCQYVVQCPRLVASPQGHINCSHPWGNFNFKSSCLFGCFEGFQLSKSIEVECLSSGNWSSTSPSCIATCNKKLCGQHGECVKTINNYTCNCDKGFYGYHCQFDQAAVQHPQKNHLKTTVLVGGITAGAVTALTLIILLISRQLKKAKRGTRNTSY